MNQYADQRAHDVTWMTAAERNDLDGIAGRTVRRTDLEVFAIVRAAVSTGSAVTHLSTMGVTIVARRPYLPWGEGK